MYVPPWSGILAAVAAIPTESFFTNIEMRGGMAEVYKPNNYLIGYKCGKPVKAHFNISFCLSFNLNNIFLLFFQRRYIKKIKLAKFPSKIFRAIGILIPKSI